MTLQYNTQMKILHLACLNSDPEIQPNMGPKCNSVGGEPLNNRSFLSFFTALDMKIFMIAILVTFE